MLRRTATTALRAAHSKSWGKRVVHTKTWTWDFPYCSGCIAHVRSYSYGSLVGMLYVVSMIVLCVMVVGATGLNDETAGFAIVVGGALTAAAGVTGYIRQTRKARAMCFASCTNVGRAVEYANWYGSTHSFNIASRKYAARFMSANAKKLINLTEDGRRLMEWAISNGAGARPENNVQITIASPVLRRPTTHEGADADDENLVRYLSKLETVKGAAARRATVEAGLKLIRSEPVKQRLRSEAVRIEIRAVLDKVETLKTASAKKRHLMDALDDVRAYGVGDHPGVAAVVNALRDLDRATP